jgi:protein-S-isoprenylcysteine O-methyltransferase Ste14
MGDDASDPIDRRRTTQPLAGETMKNTAKTPGLAFVAVAVVSFVVCLAGFAVRQVNVGIGAAIVALLAAGAALAWLSMEGRRVRQVQREWKRSSTRRGARLRR